MSGAVEQRRDIPPAAAEATYDVGRRVVHLESFEAPFSLAADEREAYLRRFATLFADDARSRRGGLGRVTYVTNALGEPFALKTLILLDDAAGAGAGDGAAPVEKDPGADAASPAAADALVAAFRREYESQRALGELHGFPRLYGWGTVEGAPAIVMEWVEGVTLAEARRALAVDGAGRLSPLVVAELGTELFELVSRLALVGEGLVHRDLSPANVMVRTNHRTLDEQAAAGSFDLCLIDFGSASPVQAGAGAGSFTRRHATVRHATADYAPPEMLSDDIAAVEELRRSPAIDVYAAASILCELLGGEAPYAHVGEGAGRATSPYRLKTEHAPARPRSAHAEAERLADVLVREGEVAELVAPLALERGLSPDDGRLRRALALADDQLADALLRCLATDQRRRPDAATMRDELSALRSRYAENVGRALDGEPLTPCMTSGAWVATEPPSSARRVGRGVGRALSAAVWAGVALSAGTLLDGTPVTLQAGPLAWSGELGALAVVALLALPAVAGALARGREAASGRALARAGAALLAVTAAVAALALTQPELGARWPGLLAALGACAAAAWCPLALDYATAVIPALAREAAREA